MKTNYLLPQGQGRATRDLVCFIISSLKPKDWLNYNNSLRYWRLQKVGEIMSRATLGQVTLNQKRVVFYYFFALTVINY